MKSRATILLILALTLLLGSCAGREAARTLDRIALLADSHPDSALSLLDSLAPHLDHSDALRARHTALSAHARHKADLPPLATAELEAAAAEFMRNPSPATTDHVLCFYHLGMAREADSIYAGSLVAYTRAEHAAKEIGDHHLLGLIYRHMASVYCAIHLSEEQLTYSELSLRQFRAAESHPHQQYALLDMAIAYNNADRYDDCISTADSVINIAYQESDFQLLTEAIGVKAMACVGNGYYPEAIALYKDLIELNGGLSWNQARDLSLAYVLSGKNDSAKIYIDEFACCESRADSLRAYYEYNLYSGNYKDALDGLFQDVIAQNQVLTQVMNQKVTTTMRDYDAYELQLEREQSSRHRFRWIAVSIISICLIITLLAICYSFYLSVGKKKLEAEMNMAAAQELTIKLNEANRMLSETSQLLTEKSGALRDTTGSLRSMFQSRLASLEALCDALYQFSGTSRQQHELRDKAMTQIMEFGQSPDSIRVIRTILDQTHDRVMEHFTADFPDVKEESYLLFTYMVLGLSSRAISVLTEVDITRVYKRKSALKKMILASDTPRRDHYLKFMV